MRWPYDAPAAYLDGAGLFLLLLLLIGRRRRRATHGLWHSLLIIIKVKLRAGKERKRKRRKEKKETHVSSDAAHRAGPATLVITRTSPCLPRGVVASLPLCEALPLARGGAAALGLEASVVLRAEEAAAPLAAPSPSSSLLDAAVGKGGAKMRTT